MFFTIYELPGEEHGGTVFDVQLCGLSVPAYQSFEDGQAFYWHCAEEQAYRNLATDVFERLEYPSLVQSLYVCDDDRGIG